MWRVFIFIQIGKVVSGEPGDIMFFRSEWVTEFVFGIFGNKETKTDFLVDFYLAFILGGLP